MKTPKSRCVVASFLLLLGLASAAGAEEPTALLRASGLAFPWALPGYGQSLEVVGRIEADGSRPPFPMVPAEREYTWTLTGPVVYQIEEPAPGIRYLSLTFGVLEIREDSATNSQYSPNPPNAAVPSTFHDGGILLLGTVTGLRVREIFGLTTASGDLHFEGGSVLDSLEGDHEWAFDAAVSPFGSGIPAGYGAAWNLDLTPRVPVSIGTSSWGGIKALYR